MSGAQPYEVLYLGWGVARHPRHGDTAQATRVPGEIPPITVTRAATASAAKTGAGEREGAGSSASFMYKNGHAHIEKRRNDAASYRQDRQRDMAGTHHAQDYIEFGREPCRRRNAGQ